MTDSFIKIVNPGRTPDGRLFCKITYNDRRLSIAGVEGPLSNGDCRGSCGQCVDALDRITCHADGWKPSQVQEFANIWRDWHLNYMRPYSPEMKALGWHKKSCTPVTGYHFTRTTSVYLEQREIEKRAIKSLRNGMGVPPATSQELAILQVPIGGVVLWCYPHEPQPPAPIGMELEKTEQKTLGWIYPSDHPDGLLTRKVAPDDKHGYGQQWWLEDVPEGVLQALRQLPDSPTKPNWF